MISFYRLLVKRIPYSAFRYIDLSPPPHAGHRPTCPLKYFTRTKLSISLLQSLLRQSNACPKNRLSGCWVFGRRRGSESRAPRKPSKKGLVARAAQLVPIRSSTLLCNEELLRAGYSRDVVYFQEHLVTVHADSELVVPPLLNRHRIQASKTTTMAILRNLLLKYIPAGGVLATTSVLYATRQVEFVPLLPSDPILHCKYHKDLNPNGNPTIHDLHIRKVPLSQIEPSLLRDQEKLVEKFCGGIWAGSGE